jgi:predicted DNA-binding transcriptional regulator AlpA
VSYGALVELRLAGLAEVAALLGVSKRTATRYTNRDDFPAPLARLAAGPIWLEDDVRKWQQTTVVRRGRPRTPRD